MRVVNISQNFEIIGGSDIYFKMLTNLLRLNNIKVEEFASTKDPLLFNKFPKSIDFDKPGINGVFKYLYNNEAKSKLDLLLNNFSPNIAHLHIYYGQLSSSILSPLKDREIPIVQTLHEYKLVCPTYKLYDGNSICKSCSNNKFYNSIIKKCNRGSFVRSSVSAIESYVSLAFGSQSKVDKFITVSEFQKQQIVEMGIPEDKMVTVHNFVNVNNNYFRYSHGNYVLYFGRIEKVKGIEVLIDSIELLDENIKLVIVGKGEDEDSIIKKIDKSKKLKNRISFLGYKSGDELAEIIYNCRFVVVPSIWYETFGLTVVEAMAYFKPVIGSRIGGITEIINDGIDGFLVDSGDKFTLAEKIKALWMDDDLVEKMGNAARHKVLTKFSPMSHFDKILKVYQQLL